MKAIKRRFWLVRMPTLEELKTTVYPVGIWDVTLWDYCIWALLPYPIGIWDESYWDHCTWG